MPNPRAEIIATIGWCVADGVTRTNLLGRGLETGYPPELWSGERPDDILWLDNNFIDTGSDLILSNSFGGTTFRLKLHNAQARVSELNEAAAKLARQAAEAHTRSTGRQLVVAGSIGPTGELFEPIGALTHSTATAAFCEQASALAKGGVDVLWIYGSKPCHQMKRLPRLTERANSHLTQRP